MKTLTFPALTMEGGPRCWAADSLILLPWPLRTTMTSPARVPRGAPRFRPIYRSGHTDRFSDRKSTDFASV